MGQVRVWNSTGCSEIPQSLKGVQYLFVASDRRCVLRTCVNNDTDYDDGTKCTHVIALYAAITWKRGYILLVYHAPFSILWHRNFSGFQLTTRARKHITGETHHVTDRYVFCNSALGFSHYSDKIYSQWQDYNATKQTRGKICPSFSFFYFKTDCAGGNTYHWIWITSTVVRVNQN